MSINNHGTGSDLYVNPMISVSFVAQTNRASERMLELPCIAI